MQYSAKLELERRCSHLRTVPSYIGHQHHVSRPSPLPMLSSPPTHTHTHTHKHFHPPHPPFSRLHVYTLPVSHPQDFFPKWEVAFLQFSYKLCVRTKATVISLKLYTLFNNYKKTF